MSNKEKINNLREELNESITHNEDYSIIYDISVKLDKLIAEYYEIGSLQPKKQMTYWEKMLYFWKKSYKFTIFFKNIWQFKINNL